MSGADPAAPESAVIVDDAQRWLEMGRYVLSNRYGPDQSREVQVAQAFALLSIAKSLQELVATTQCLADRQ